MATCTTRTLEGMYIFSNPPKAVAAPVSLKQHGKPSNYKNYRNSTIANNYRSIYSPNHFISGRPLSSYWWREKKETYEQRLNGTPLGGAAVNTNGEERKSSAKTPLGKDLQDAVCQTDAFKEEADTVSKNILPTCTHASSQTSASFCVDELDVKQEVSEVQLSSQNLLAQVEQVSSAQDKENVPLEIISRMLSRSYVEVMLPNLLCKFKEHGIPDGSNKEDTESAAVLPWLMNELELGLSRLESSYKLLNQSNTS